MRYNDHISQGLLLGHIGSIISLASQASDKQALLDFGRKLAMQIVGFSPVYVRTSEVPKQLQKELGKCIAKPRELILTLPY